jgi:hypothetical protein
MVTLMAVGIRTGHTSPATISYVFDPCMKAVEGPCTTACENQIKIGDRCLFKRNYGKICFSNKMCKTRNAVCLDNKHNEVVNRENVDVVKTGHCYCDQTHNYAQDTDECRLAQPPCTTNEQCGDNFICQADVCVCRYEHHSDHRVYVQHCVHNKTIPQYPHLCPIGASPNSRSCLQYFKPSDFNSALEPNWTLTLWKLLVLSSILVSLLLLARRIKRAQRYDERIRSMYYQREAVRRAFIYSASPREASFSESNQIASTTSVDLPPTYDEAIKTHVLPTTSTTLSASSAPATTTNPTTAIMADGSSSLHTNTSSSV